jgi:hypothetical protein
MITRHNIALQGYFDYKIYDQFGNLKEVKTGIKNFITSTGLTFPFTYAFADCFRFISLGSGFNQNTILGSYGGTTGLSSGIQEFTYIGSRTSFSDPTTSNYENPGCGYTESLGQLTLSRSFKIPSGSGTFDNNYIFNELMLSPGRPTGMMGTCGCGGQDTSNGGVDASIIADYYDSISSPSICSAHQAFTRIILSPSISVNTRDYLVVNYNLNIIYDSGVDLFATLINNNFSSYWTGYISGRSNIIHHGLKLINDGGIIDQSSYRNQASPFGENYDWIDEYGESYIPLWGAPLEPSCPAMNLVSYLSTDNVQFLVNQVSGGAIDIGNWQPYNPTGYPASSGLKAFVPKPSDTTDASNFNIRTTLTGPLWPAQTGVFAQAISYPDGTNYILHSSFGKQKISFIPSGRSRSSLYSCVFTNLNAFNWLNGTSPTPLVRSMIYNYADANAISNNTYYPFLDLLFSGTQGEGLVPTGSDTSYSNPTNNYYPLGNGGDLSIAMSLTWSSICNSGVIGC